MKREDLKNKIIAHRGIYNNNILENTKDSFVKAINKNLIIEFDVRLTKDNKVIIYHDEDLNRLFNINKLIKDLTLKEINNISSHILTLEEGLNIIDSKVPILIEIKSEDLNNNIIDLTMKILSKYKGKYGIQSFNPYVIYYLKKHYNYVLRGQLSSSFKNKKMNIIKKMILKNMLLNFMTKPDFISYNYKDLDNKKIQKLKKKYILLGYTIKDNETYFKLKDKYDSLICEKII